MKLDEINTFQDVPASSVSQKVLNKVLSSRFKGYTDAIFNHSFNIRTSDRFIINIGTDMLPLTPRSILVPFEDFYSLILPKVSSGLLGWCYDGSIYLPQVHLSISVKTAAQFNPKLELSSNLLPDNKVKRNLVSVVEWAEMERQKLFEISPSPLTGYFLSRCSFIGSPREEELKEMNPSPRERCDGFCDFKKMLWKRIDSFLCAMKRYSWDDVSSSIHGIIGFGPGLTPSGDDFLAGFISIGVIFAKIWHDVDEFMRKILRIVNKESIGRTTDISLSMLEDASDGEIAEPAINFISSALLTDNMNQIKYFAKQLSSMGGSSGVDLINGVATGIWFFKKMISNVNSEKFSKI